MISIQHPLWFLRLIIWLLPSIVCAQQTLDFNRDIRPILAENCFYCHGQDSNKRQADLRLDQRDVAISSGAIVPNDAAGSAMIQRMNSVDPDVLMPPVKSNRRLSAEQKVLLERWISEGGKYQTHWAFETPIRPVTPDATTAGWVRNPIDSFVLQRLELAGWQPSPEADRSTLIRRL